MLCWRYKICSCLTGDALRWWAWTPVERLAGVARQQRGGRGVLDLCPRFPPASAMASSVICCSCPFLREALFIYTLGFGKPAAGRLFPPEEWYLGVSDTLYLVNFVSYLWPTFVSYIWPTLSPICGQLLSHISDQLCLLFVANLLKRRTSETRVENTRRHIARTKTSCRDKQIIRQIKNHIIRTNSPGRASSEAQHRWKVHFCCWVNELQASCLLIVREQHKANLFLVTK